MYSFIDTNEMPDIECLPAEAVQFAGVWLDQAVSGFQTLYTAGREQLQTEIEDISTPARDGAFFQRKRYKPRTITVGYQLVAPNAKAFRSAFQQLAVRLSPQQSELRFADDPRRHYIATLSAIGDIPPGRNSVTGEITFYCADPFLYSDDIKTIDAAGHTAEGDAQVISVDYAGTYPARPLLQADIASDTSYMVFVQDSTSVIVGDEAQRGREAQSIPVSVFRENFRTFSPAGLPAGWSMNDADLNISSTHTQNGSFAASAYSKKGQSGITHTGSRGSTGWRGTSLTYTLSDVGSAPFDLTFDALFAMPQSSDKGVLQVIVNGPGGLSDNICGITLFRTTVGNIHGNIFAFGHDLKNFNYSCKADNDVSGNKSGPITLSRDRGGISFSLPNGSAGGMQVTDQLLASLEAATVSFYFGTAGGSGTPGQISLVSARMTQNAIFSAGDTVTADTATGEIAVNGTLRPEFGAVSNNWAGMALQPGHNEILIASNGETEPTCSMTWREVFL